MRDACAIADAFQSAAATLHCPAEDISSREGGGGPADGRASALARHAEHSVVLVVGRCQLGLRQLGAALARTDRHHTRGRCSGGGGRWWGGKRRGR